ncbi:hypothetical protein H5P28_12815 [Ruficoccus amylovorans]|uniref:Uncharacterized protein n=1 Tax=Ruficoccus amylovorans TaxID=1804625 RepID=A0A842HFE7_9BACT|nr:hypothetical protein [Ruficoccus amylovorans]MBC2595142.1 hypothetical protein [Ruficoccus amylovorans]
MMGGKLYATAWLTLMLCWTTAAPAADITPGDTYADMVSALGEPQGYFELADKTLYLYPAGKVTVVNQVVTAVELKTQSELDREAALKAESARQWEAHKQMKQARQQEKGEKLKNDKLSDPAFLSLSSGEQLAFWKRFQRDFPEIGVTEIVTPLAERFAREQEELARAESQLKAQQQKINSLEQRVQDAEKSAQEAELAAARQSAYSNYSAFYGTEYPAYYYPYPQSRVVIVNSDGNTTVIPANPRPYYRRSGVQVNGSIGSVNFRYSSGGSPYYQGGYPGNSTIIVRTPQTPPPQNP